MNPIRNKQLILIVDDDEATRILIRGIFEGANIEIIESDCGEKALKLFRKYSTEIDLILLDILLPGFNGWDLLKKFRKKNQFIQVIALSALTPSDLVKKAQIAGFNACVSKPFDILELKRVVLSFLE